MPPFLRNVLVVLAGLIIGGVVNMALITIGPMIIPVPEGVDMTTPEGISAAMPLLSPQHFIFPFLAHALGTLVGAFFVGSFAASGWKILCLIVGAFFLIGGISMVMMVPSPMWFTLVDLILAYIPMGLLGWKLSGAKI